MSSQKPVEAISPVEEKSIGLNPLEQFVTTFKQFLNVYDCRFEAYQAGTEALWKLLIRDTLAGVIVALVAIPLSVGIAVASHMRPEQGIAAAVIAGILGGVFGGSKYQVYGPTAAYITIISGIALQYDVPFLILCTLISGVLLAVSGFFGLGRYFRYVPHSVIVGFTIGIAATIIITQLPETFGIHGVALSHMTLEKLRALPGLFIDANAHALVLAIMTFFLIRKLYQISIYIPAPLIAIVVGSFVANVLWHDNFVPLLSTKYGHMNGHLFHFTLPGLGDRPLWSLIGPVISVYFIAALESLLSSRMADRLANNPTPFDPDKEFFGQGIVNLVSPIFNGMACTGALARTATSIKVGAVSPLASVLIGGFVLVITMFFAPYLSTLPMSCMGGLLVYVAMNMVKKKELEDVFVSGKFEVGIMAYTAIMTVCTDLMIAVISATALYYAPHLFSKLGPKPSNG